MKKFFICLFIFAIGHTVNAQRFHRFQSDWKVSVGVNAVGSLGTRNPFKKLGDFAFQFPLAVAIEHQWSEQFALEQDITLNGFKTGTTLDTGTLSEKLTYFSTNTNLKWYFADYLFDVEYFDLYLSGGLGIFYMDEINTSSNLSAGAQYWFNENIAVRLQSTAKFATNPKDHLYANNHFQYVLQVVFRL
ncbi:MAG: hypothetical protein ACOH2D_17645 [Gelidibacter sp.]|uniref:hypothetical protein n=1 Tax=Gelidibacter sp. TaxID=2018083 RepID=UPI0032652CBC